HEDVMKILEKLIVKVIKDVKRHCKDELEILGRELETPKLPFERLEYEEVVEIVNSSGVHLKHGEDLSRAAEKALGEAMSGYYFIKSWPTNIKPFYVMPKEDDPSKSYAFDLMYKDLEVSSGAMRVHEHDLLFERIKRQGLNPRSFKSYLSAFKYGMPPHAGWGLGAERFTMALLDIKNIRETVLFPRDRRRLTP
ncbi:MAG: amino acid--tRNA ligase-related protein, partial [Methanobacteriales archaeon]